MDAKITVRTVPDGFHKLATADRPFVAAVDDYLLLPVTAPTTVLLTRTMERIATSSFTLPRFSDENVR